MTNSSIAVIGSGISGLSAAWLLSRTQNVTLFEKDERPGGHANTIVARTAQGDVAVDTGFIVYNERNYPNLTALFDHLKVETARSYMTFAVSVGQGEMEYSGEYLWGLFGQRRNIISPRHWKLVADIMRFFRDAEKQIATCDDDLSIGDFLKRFGYSQAFIDDHILPISAAIWSTPSRGMLDFPAKTFIGFFANHSLLQVLGRPTWRTVKGGSREYVSRILADQKTEVVTSAKIVSVRRHAQGAEIYFEDGSHRHFDQVVFACHADQALALLADPTEAEQRVLSCFQFTKNKAVLHTDARFMPKRRHLWSAWNYLRSSRGEDNLSLTYWMNKLQPLPTTTNLFVTLNPHMDFAPGSIQYEVDYEHPLFDTTAVEAQNDLWQVQGVNSTWFAGAWMGYGFHEDGLQAGLEVAERIGGLLRPWNLANQRYRIAHNWAQGEQLLAAE
ncbi:FAD-dependent oxidoreductase [Devosia sp. Leaf64]|uniref:NAD(P)/FAD-dependent oxidoreductase n=1 Tax=Devosia sp. Leaf64 TaxID=1736229 RepID=UPI000712F36E|nr:FAD-dependent oxidoreductase [Devosia sp. Leaf64]KQN72630.1 NADH-ubiquinone oxidoreductase subunit 6 [Devosia sp. Leaf64]